MGRCAGVRHLPPGADGPAARRAGAGQEPLHQGTLSRLDRGGRDRTLRTDRAGRDPADRAESGRKRGVTRNCGRLLLRGDGRAGSAQWDGEYGQGVLGEGREAVSIG